MNFLFKIKNKIIYIKEKIFCFLEEYFLKHRMVKLESDSLIFDIGYNKGKFSKKIIFEWTEENFSQLEKSIYYLKSIGYNYFGVVGYFINKEYLNDKILFSRKGDPFLIEPDNFECEIINLKKFIVAERKINYGMIWVK